MCKVKTILSIPLIILILFSGISIKFAAHYCGGSVAATKISLSGELATCGMEHQSGNNIIQYAYRDKCCNDVTSAYSICNIYYPSSNFFKVPVQQVLSMIIVPSAYLINQEIIINTTNINVRPPGTSFPNSVSRPSICIFRI